MSSLKSFYFAPFTLVHKSLWLRATEKTVQIFHEQQLVATHPRLHKPCTRSTVKDHLPPEATAYLMRDPQWCLVQAQKVENAAKSWSKASLPTASSTTCVPFKACCNSRVVTANDDWRRPAPAPWTTGPARIAT